MTSRAPDRARLQAQLERAAELHRAQRLGEAVSLYRQILQAAPRHPDTLHLYGLALHQGGSSLEALEPLQRAVTLAPDNGAFRLTHAGVLRALGRVGEAVAALQRGVEAAPADPRLPALLGELLAGQGEYEAASEAFRRCLSIAPAQTKVLSNLAASLNRLGRHEEALEAARQAVDRQPDLLPALLAGGEALIRLGRAAEAREPLRRALALEPISLITVKALALALELAGELEESLEVLKRGLDLAPADAELHGGRGRVLQGLGRLREAKAALEQALALAPDHTDSLAASAEGQALKASSPLARRLARNLGDPERPTSERANAGFALARALQRGGEHARAFEAAEQANFLMRRQRPHDPAAYDRYVDALIETFDAALFRRLTGAGCADERPVFIVGMPRSGTSLVEQILASHPSVFGAGELIVLPALARSLPGRLGSSQSWPTCGRELTAVVLEGVAADYLAAWPAAAAGAGRVTDKLPANDHYLGLIALALPRARVLCCRRDPRDVALSNYFHLFQRGHTYTHDLLDLARHVLAHRRLMIHWRELLSQLRPDFALLEVEHERLVLEPEQEARRLVAHCGLPWDPACLEFHETQRAVRTASHWQVRRPLDRGAVGRWRDYRQQFAPFVDALAAGGLELPD